MTGPVHSATIARSASASGGSGVDSRYSMPGSTPTVLKIRRVTELKNVWASSASGRSRLPVAWSAFTAAQRVRSMTASPRMSRTSATAASRCTRYSVSRSVASLWAASQSRRSKRSRARRVISSKPTT